MSDGRGHDKVSVAVRPAAGADAAVEHDMYRMVWKSSMFLVARNNRFASTMIVMAPSHNGIRHIEHRADGNIGGGLDIVDSLDNVNEEIGDYILDAEFTGHEYAYCECAKNAHLIPE